MPSGSRTMRCVYTREDIACRVRDIGAAVNAEYAGKDTVLICVLKGAFMFFSDLLRELRFEPQIDFVRLASYGDGMRTTRSISFTKDVEIPLKDKHVLLVEDVIDSGRTMKFLLRRIKARRVASLKVAVLVDKTDQREVLIKPDFVGFNLANGFIVGYGLDYAEQHRELPALYEIASDV